MPIHMTALSFPLSMILSVYAQSEATLALRPWAEAMAAFEALDTQSSPAPGGVVFVGSSSIVRWDLPRWFGDLEGPLVNRGFGGSQIEDSARELDLLVLRHKPRAIVFYAGDNDVAAGKSAERVEEDFARFIDGIRAALPKTPIFFIAIKPSTSRWRFEKIMRDANARIQARCEDDPTLRYVDIWTPMLGDDGRPRAELLAEDGLHLSDEGYALWSRLVLGTLDSE